MQVVSHPKGPLVKGNFFKFSMANEASIYKYLISVTPNLEGNQMKVFWSLTAKIRKELQEKFETYITNNFYLYSPNNILESIEFTVQHENSSYVIRLDPDGILDFNTSKIELLNFLGRFFKLVQLKLRMKSIGRKYFNPEAASHFQQLQLQIWPGFQTSVKNFGKSIFLNIDSCQKVYRTETVLEYINSIKSQGQNFINNAMKGQIVMTTYNQRMYRVNEIDFERTPNDKFKLKDDKEISLKEYYYQRYNKNIETNQPLIVSIDRKTKNRMELIPQLCVMTGLSDRMRNDFNLMKQISGITKPNAPKKLEEIKNLLKMIQKNDATSQFLKEWNIYINDNPISFDSSVVRSGNMLFGKERKIKIDPNDRDFDKKTQTVMFESPPLKKWAIFCEEREKEICQKFLQTLQECFKQYEWSVNPPKVQYVRGQGRFTQYQDWVNEFKSLNLNASVDFIILILPGKKKAAPLYSDLKQLLITKIGIPNQVILSYTIQQGKGLRSICNKLLVQMCAKAGGIPWSIDDLPFTSQKGQPETMIIGIDVFHQTRTNSASTFAFCATCDATFSKYNTVIREQKPGEEIGVELQSCTVDALQDFKSVNNCLPKTVIVYRDGVSPSQQKAINQIEAPALRRAFEIAMKNEGITEPIKLILICCNKMINQKFFDAQQQHVQNCEPGTVIDEERLCEAKEFYLISQKTRQGIASPTHYYILINDFINESSTKEDELAIQHSLESLSFKLCHLYFNWTGAIKIPAPIRYAHSLADFAGKRWGTEPVHGKFRSVKSLYFI